MEANPEAGLAGPRVLNGDGTVQASCMRAPTWWNCLSETLGLHRLFPGRSVFAPVKMDYWAHDTRRDVDVLSGCFWFARRAAVEDIGLLDERFFFYAEDMDWCRRFRNGGWRVAFVPQAQAIHYGGGSSSNAPVRFFIEKRKADLKYWRKHHGRMGQVYFAGCVVLGQSARALGWLALWLAKPGAREWSRTGLQRSAGSARWMLLHGFNGLCARPASKRQPEAGPPK